MLMQKNNNKVMTVQTIKSKEKNEIHIAHIVYSFSTGGLENGMVNLINHLPCANYKHSIICLTTYDKDFFARIKTPNTDIYSLNKPPGNGVSWLFRCWKLLRKLNPDICHSRNLSAMEAQVAAFMSNVPFRLHGEHGWDVRDLGGVNQKFQYIRRILKPFIHQFIGLSVEATDYLECKIKVSPNKINHICNGVDIEKFKPFSTENLLPAKFFGAENLIFSTVGRLAEVKNQTFLVDAFLALLKKYQYAQNLKLVVVGEGELLPTLKEKVSKANAENHVWFAGNRHDVDKLMPQFDVFILPSLAEGISNTFLEAMACGLPVIATDVGGNVELMYEAHKSSHLVGVNNISELVNSMSQFVESKEYLRNSAVCVRNYCVENFSIDTMVNKYHQIYLNNNTKGLS